MTEVMAAEIEKLIEQLKKLTGPDRELDFSIYRIVSGRKIDADGFITFDHQEATGHISRFAPHYTKSIDAALTLVPVGFAWFLRTTPFTSPMYWADAKKYEPLAKFVNEGGVRHSLPAIALCIAALRALSHKGSSND
ncbi:MAG: hypothetical protein KIT15_16910 [Xanthobacteraceae bacterium]|nr:hypothetical protein [Xanthobacteraceae bacterium]